MRGTLHEIAFFVSVPAGIALIALANTGKARFAAVVFATGLVGVFGASAAYHRVAWSDPGAEADEAPRPLDDLRPDRRHVHARCACWR